jgi:hypothetical protein
MAGDWRISLVASALGLITAGHGAPATILRGPPVDQGSLEGARDALASRESIRLLKSIVLSGSFVRGFDGVTGAESTQRQSIEIRLLLPDNYLRIESNGFVERRAGFSGPNLLNQWKALRSDVQFGVTFAADQIVLERHECARLLLGMLAFPAPSLGVHVTSDRTNANVRTLELTGNDGFAVRLDLERASLVPLRLRLDDVVRLPVALSEAQKRTGVPPLPQPVRMEVTWVFEDRRSVGGLYVPHRVRRLAGTVVLEDMRIDRVLVNLPLRRADFAGRN